jgi:dihydroneopterin aldolase
MALLAMEQFGAAICSLEPALVPVASLRKLRQTLRSGRTPVWMATKMALEAATSLPASWNVTSDSLAAWLAGRVGSGHVLLVKHGAPFGDGANMKDLIGRGIVDPLLPNYLSAANAHAVFLGPADTARASEFLGSTIDARFAGGAGE